MVRRGFFRFLSSHGSTHSEYYSRRFLCTACSDITREFAGSVLGAMTTFGSLVGWISPVVTARVTTSFGWPYALDAAALMTVVGGMAWFIIDVSQSVE